MKRVLWLAGILLLLGAAIAIRGQEEKPRIALTFDDGPNSVYTPKLLDGLKERGVKATFFLIGENIEGNEAIVQRMKEEGHLIGNHTYTHVQLNQVSDEKAKEEIEKTGNRIYEITGEYPVYLRPPYGSWKKNLELSVEMIPVLWTIDTLDWQNKNVHCILCRTYDEIKDGAVILMHDEYGTSVDAALQLVDELLAQNYRFVTVDELLTV